jgi:hypothetical protein
MVLYQRSVSNDSRRSEPLFIASISRTSNKPQGEVYAIRATHTVVVFRQVLDEYFELYALDSSYCDRLRFGGLQVWMLLKPADHILGGLKRLV